MSAERFEVLIVGGGHAGAQAAATLRQLGFGGTVAIVGEEAWPPYERPPLSKDFLAGKRPFERMLLRPTGFWEERGVELLLGRRIVAVDAAARWAIDAEGRRITYDKLVWAAGGRPRSLPCPGGDRAGVHAIRTRDDVERLRAELPNVARAVIVGGGYVGLEAAAVLIGTVASVTIVEAQPRLLSRVAGPVIADYYRRLHAARGVDIRLSETVTAIEDAGRASDVVLSSGERLRADLIVVGIGILPNVEPLIAAGARGGDGVMVDSSGRTDLPAIWAIGDCAAYAHPYVGGAIIRVESVGNANDMAVAACRDIVALPPVAHDPPWFWSNQYDARLQTIGIGRGFDEEVVRGVPDDGRFSVAYLRDGRVIALDCVNRVKDFVGGRALVVGGVMVPRASLADADIPLATLAAEPVT